MATIYCPETETHLTIDPISLAGRISLYKTVRQIVPIITPINPIELWHGAIRMSLELVGADIQGSIKWGIWNPNPGITVIIHRIQIMFSSRDPGLHAFDQEWQLKKYTNILSFDGRAGIGTGIINPSAFKNKNTQPQFKSQIDDTTAGATIFPDSSISIGKVIHSFNPCSDMNPSATVQTAQDQHRLWWTNSIELEANELITLEISSAGAEPQWRFDGSAFVSEVLNQDLNDIN